MAEVYTTILISSSSSRMGAMDMPTYAAEAQSSMRPIEPRDLECKAAVVSAKSEAGLNVSAGRINDLVQRIATGLRLKFDPSHPLSGKPLSCNVNCEIAVEQGGGEVVHGYLAVAFKASTVGIQVSEAAACGLDLMAHAVWLNPAGELVELTPFNDGGNFIEDEQALPIESQVIRTFKTREARTEFIRGQHLPGTRHVPIDLAENIPPAKAASAPGTKGRFKQRPKKNR